MTFGKASPRTRVSRAVSRPLLGLAPPFLVLGLLSAGSGCGGDTEPRPPTWSYISTAILEPSCATANCHSAIAMRAGVDLSTRAAGYASLVGNDAVPRFYVISQRIGDGLTPPLTAEQRLERSSVPKLMRAVGNLRMPPDLPLPEPDIQLFESWIRAGAKND
ncbi:MAG TPA: hypothetical protein VFH68_17275 [Polyangia bacterium]|jgi:hypothetical protein|nr:hypothetical protein [Polyangia bacterium]